MIWACPVCREGLRFEGASAVCDQQHRFDRARQGYWNLLLAHRKGSQVPGDTREMMLARRAFLGGGAYESLIAQLGDWLTAACRTRTEPLRLLDSGCGEGHYLHRLMEISGCEAYGLDISKEAIKLAARQNPKVSWVVANGFDLPVQTGAVDVLLRVFAPGDDAQVRRVLSPQGEFWRVQAGPDHLAELKAALYDTPKPHAAPPLPLGFELLEEVRVRFPVSLSTPAQQRDLVAMTPFVWQAPKIAQDRLNTLVLGEVTADFVVQRFRAMPAEPLGQPLSAGETSHDG